VVGRGPVGRAHDRPPSRRSVEPLGGRPWGAGGSPPHGTPPRACRGTGEAPPTAAGDDDREPPRGALHVGAPTARARRGGTGVASCAWPGEPRRPRPPFTGLRGYGRGCPPGFLRGHARGPQSTRGGGGHGVRRCGSHLSARPPLQRRRALVGAGANPGSLPRDPDPSGLGGSGAGAPRSPGRGEGGWLSRALARGDPGPPSDHPGLRRQGPGQRSGARSRRGTLRSRVALR
jgi:hypothetical protein